MNLTGPNSHDDDYDDVHYFTAWHCISQRDDKEHSEYGLLDRFTAPLSGTFLHFTSLHFTSSFLDAHFALALLRH